MKRHGQADAIEFFDKERILTHHEQRERRGDADDEQRRAAAAATAADSKGAMRRAFEQDPDNGRWGWKPAVILAALERAKPGDFVVYTDTSQFFTEGVKHSFVPLCDWLTAAMVGAHGDDALKVRVCVSGGRGWRGGLSCHVALAYHVFFSTQLYSYLCHHSRNHSLNHSSSNRLYYSTLNLYNCDSTYIDLRFISSEWIYISLRCECGNAAITPLSRGGRHGGGDEAAGSQQQPAQPPLVLGQRVQHVSDAGARWDVLGGGPRRRCRRG